MKLPRFLSALLDCLVLPAPVALYAADAPAQKFNGYTYVKTVGAISEYTLDVNGLTVLLLP